MKALRRSALVVALVALVLGGCAAPVVRETPSEPPTEVPARPAPVEPSATTAPAVLGLLQRANDAVIGGDLHAADSLLERALRIEPTDPVVWHYLARVRYVQGRPDQAVAAASKSNAFARDNRAVAAANWRIIAQARRQQGDADGARLANSRAAALER